MTVVNTHEAKTHLSRLLARVEAGEEVVIARNGRPIARLVRAEPERPAPKLGWAQGEITLLPGWDDPMTEEELADWYDGPIFPESAE